MNRRNRAFTLLELLTVIAILTLLIGILVPSLSAARRRAKANVCLSKLKGISTGFVVYLNENRDTFPPHRLRKVDPSQDEEYVNEYDNKSPRWQWFLELESGPVIDPRPMKRLRRPWGDDERGLERFTMTMTNDDFVCPALDDEEFSHNIRNGAYGYNYQYLGNARQQSDPKRWDNFPVSLHRIKSPAQTVLLADSRGAGMPHGLHSYTLDPPRLATEAGAKQFAPDLEHVQPGLTPPESFQFSPAEMRHSGLGNVAFVDTHVEAMTLTQLGYELADVDRYKDVAIPVLDPTTAKRATNKLWNGLGIDASAATRNP